MKKLALITGLIAATALAHAPAVAGHARSTGKPNVIIFLVDDLGWRDVSYAGSTFYKTPNVDKLAASGVRFTNAYAASPVCSPTRAALLTGRDPVRLGITDWIPGYVPPAPTTLQQPKVADRLALEEATIAEMFKTAGYRTMFAGKWHLGPSPDAWPEAHGFDINAGGIETGGPPKGAYFSPYHNPRLADGPPGGFLTDRLARETSDFIKANADRPFFVVHSFYQVHSPLTAAPAFIEHYEAKARALPPLASSESVVLRNGSRDRARQDNPVYGSMVAAFDAAIGTIMTTLRQQGLDENTIIVFTSDNGGWSWVTPRGTSATSNLPLRGGKGWLYEGGIRVPLVIRAPGVSRPGSVADAPTTTVDLLPTLLDLTGISSRPSKPIDGVSLRASLTAKPRPGRDLYWHYPHYHNFASSPHGAIRSGRYKLIEHFEDGRLELYDLKHDPGEERNLAASEPNMAARLLRRLKSWRTIVGAKVPLRSARIGNLKDGGLGRD